MIDGAIDAQAVIRHCSEMPGITECVAVTNDGQLQASSAPDGFLAADAAGLAANVRALASSLGASDNGPLTLRTGRGLASFFPSGEVCLGVLHGDEGFQAGVQERLALVAGELSSLFPSN